MEYFKSLLATVLTFLSALVLEACSTNPATGEQQFAPLMTPKQEVSVGATEHQKMEKNFGFVQDAALVNYVNRVGQRVTRDTERSDVQYKFFVLDSPDPNAMALPGGYIYVSRGLLALANNEAELASVLGHEAGHITARHSAERYSKGTVASIGASLLSIAIGNSGATQAIDLGTNLIMSSYSRSQESQADSLGIRYMVRAGYDPQAVPAFLASLHRQSQLESRMHGKYASPLAGYFATHPATADRVGLTADEIKAFPKTGETNRAAHMKAIHGMTYGDSAAHGFVRGRSFFHPAIGFAFDIPTDFQIENQPSRVVAAHNSGAVMIFDMASEKAGDPLSYLESWAGDMNLQDAEAITISGMPAATGSLEGVVRGAPATVRLVAIAWGKQVARFQIVIPEGSPSALIKGLRDAAYSFRALSAQEKNSVRPLRLVTFVANPSDTVAARAARLPFSNYKEEQFRVLNGLGPGDELKPGEIYKTVEG
jgi:predicted Zn-dependent protease